MPVTRNQRRRAKERRDRIDLALSFDEANTLLFKSRLDVRSTGSGSESGSNIRIKISSVYRGEYAVRAKGRGVTY